jgi:hypothetical protein
MTAPQIRDENRKQPTPAPRPPTRAEMRKARRALYRRPPSSERLLTRMTEGDLMTVAIAKDFLDLETQSARNCLCRLVRQRLIAIETPKANGVAATYRITHAGFNLAAERDAQLHGYELDNPEQDRAAEEAERKAALARVDLNLERARSVIPNSVFALATVRAAVRAEGATA